MTVISTEGEADSSSELVLRVFWRAAILSLIGLLLFLAWLVRVAEPYESGSGIGYDLGLIGGLLMLVLLLYPLRKRWIIFDEQFGKMEHWFNFHMVAGIAGPVLVLFHSTFRTGSINGAVALYAMIMVAVSGMLGRFIYRHIHHDLYGKELTLAEAAENLREYAKRPGSVFNLCPDIEPQLTAFYQRAFDRGGDLPRRIWKFMTLRWRSRRLAKKVRHQMKKALLGYRRTQGASRSELLINYRLARGHVDHYLDSIVTTSQMSVWERLFSYWHVLHIPFLYLLVFSGVVHVVAVHMY